VCASLGASATGDQQIGSGKAVNGTRYVVAVAAYDAVNNIGPLSYSLCQTPEVTNTFFSTYCRDGGPACPGCGQCTVGPSSSLTWPALGATALAAVGLAMRRSRGTRRRRK
jgi:hypothetical protein